MYFHQTIDANMKFKYCMMTREQKHGQYGQSCTSPNLPFNLTLYQNVMSFDETIDFKMKFRYSLIINDSQFNF